MGTAHTSSRPGPVPHLPGLRCLFQTIKNPCCYHYLFSAPNQFLCLPDTVLLSLKKNSGDDEIHFDHTCVLRFSSLLHRPTPHTEVLTSNFLQGCTCLYRCGEQLCLRFPSPWEGLATESHRKERPPTPARAPPQSPAVSGPSEAGPDSTSGAASQGQVAGFSALTGLRGWLKEVASACTPGRLSACGLESTEPFPRQPRPGVRSS